jgi:putative glycosyltransferase (TIGR04372 family)
VAKLRSKPWWRLRRWALLRDYILDRGYDWYQRRWLRHRILRNGPANRLVIFAMRRCRIRVLFNVAPGLGHNTVELDYFFRKQGLGLVGKDERVLFVRRPSAIHKDTLSLYRDRFWFATKSHFVYDLVIPAAANAPDLRIDCGLSRLKWHYEAERPLAIPFGGQNYLHQVSKAENLDAWKAYYDLRRRSSDLYPLREGIGLDGPLLQLLGYDRDRPIALVHLKYHVANATAAPTDPRAYIPAIEWLKNSGYLVVQVGRESMPGEFRALGVVNYAESAIATYRRDLQIFAHAAIAITAGSGIGTIADCVGTPFVYLDSWHVGMPMASRRCVMVPSLVRERASARLLTFREQQELYFALQDDGAETFPAEAYAGRNATADEIVAAVREALALTEREVPLSPLQRAFRELDAGGLGGVTQARVSNHFLEQHADLLAAREIEKQIG